MFGLLPLFYIHAYNVSKIYHPVPPGPTLGSQCCLPMDGIWICHVPCGRHVEVGHSETTDVATVASRAQRGMSACKMFCQP